MWRALAGLFALCVFLSGQAVSLSNGVRLRLTTITAEGSAVHGLSWQLEPASGQSFYHVFRDENNLVVFVYELAIERSADGQNFRVIAKPAEEDYARRFPNVDNGKPAPTLSAVIESPLLHSGERFRIPIPTQPGLQENVVDVVELALATPGAGGTATTAGATLRLSSLRLYINGNRVSPTGPSASVTGHYVMLYIPGRGAYFLSSEPVPDGRFIEAGWVDRNRLQFVVDNETFDGSTDSPILLQSDRGQLWVYHDPLYKPAGNWTSNDPSHPRDEFFVAGSDSLRWWLQGG